MKLKEHSGWRLQLFFISWITSWLIIDNHDDDKLVVW